MENERSPTTEYWRHAVKYALAELRLETGRTHQIRVHMQYLGAPLMGDYLYHPDFTRISRVALARPSALEFMHPITGKPMRFHVPLPEDMEKAKAARVM